MRKILVIVATMLLSHASASLAGNYLLYSAPPEALDSYSIPAGYTATPRACHETACMVWLRGEDAPQLPDGLIVLGTRYDEVWADPGKRAVYNSIFPPDEAGNPRPFGIFLGCEEEMGL